VKHLDVVIAYKAKGGSQKSSPYDAGGLACNALHTAAVLGEIGVNVRLAQVSSFEELVAYIQRFESAWPTHLIIEAVWVTVDQVRYLAETFPKTEVVVRAHSKMGFLQVEPEAIITMRRIIDLSKTFSNVHFSSNNHEFAAALSEVYGPVLYLPNLYDLVSAPPRLTHDRREPLRIASFGATRLLKLHPPAALAALQVARRLGRSMEFYVNVDSTPGGDSVRRTMRNLFANLPDAKLIEVGWQNSQTFKETIATMDLVLQLSCTETFCMVAADAIASGVPLVAGPAISWLPIDQLVTDLDDTSAAAALGVQMIKCPRKAKAQKKCLVRFIKRAKKTWRAFLGIEEQGFFF
jgi:glycosyltransferase involved in cell wall biosynthesis